MSMLYDSLGVDSLLSVLSYMNVKTLSRMACGSRLGAVAAYEAQQRPSLVVLKGTPETLASELCERLTSRPTVAFIQWSLGREKSQADGLEEVKAFVQKRLPPTTEVMAAHTESTHCAWFPEPAVPSSKKPASTKLDITGHRISSNYEISVLLATLPEAKARAFHVKPAPGMSDSSEDSGEDSEDEEVDEEQQTPEPSAADRQQAAGGYNSAASPTAPAEAKQEDELKALLAMDPAPEVVVIHHACNSQKVIDQIQAAFPKAAIIGGVVMGGRVLVRGCGKELSQGSGMGVIAISGNAPLFAMTCPYTDNVKLAHDNVQSSLRRAHDYAAERDEALLGALLFTCNGRGSGMFGKHGVDAALFQAQFPGSQLLGYYAGGEIGPEAADDGDQQTFLRGNARMQGFTAVYGLFCVPRKHSPSASFQRAVLYGEVSEAFQEISDHAYASRK